MLKRENGKSNCAGNSQATALIEAISLGGKSNRPTGPRTLLERLDTFDMKSLPHPTDERPCRVQPCRDRHVVHSFRCVQHDPGPNHLSIRCLRRSRPLFDHGSFFFAQLDPIRTCPSHVHPPHLAASDEGYALCSNLANGVLSQRKDGDLSIDARRRGRHRRGRGSAGRISRCARRGRAPTRRRGRSSSRRWR